MTRNQRGYVHMVSLIKEKKNTSELLSELRASGFSPFIDNFKDAEIVSTMDGNTVREIGEMNTLRLAKYLMRQ